MLENNAKVMLNDLISSAFEETTVNLLPELGGLHPGRLPRIWRIQGLIVYTLKPSTKE